jgi:hypothetical protein
VKIFSRKFDCDFSAASAIGSTCSVSTIAAVLATAAACRRLSPLNIGLHWIRSIHLVHRYHLPRGRRFRRDRHWREGAEIHSEKFRRHLEHRDRRQFQRFA